MSHVLYIHIHLSQATLATFDHHYYNKTEKIGVMILKVYMRINIVLLIVYPQFGKQSLLAPLIMSGVVRVRVSKSFRLRKEFQPPLRTQALQAH